MGAGHVFLIRYLSRKGIIWLWNTKSLYTFLDVTSRTL
jgi:hypothetical protein